MVFLKPLLLVDHHVVSFNLVAVRPTRVFVAYETPPNLARQLQLAFSHYRIRFCLLPWLQIQLKIGSAQHVPGNFKFPPIKCVQRSFMHMIKFIVKPLLRPVSSLARSYCWPVRQQFCAARLLQTDIRCKSTLLSTVCNMATSATNIATRMIAPFAILSSW